MLPIERKSNALAIRQDHYLQQRKELLQNHDVQIKLSEKDLMIAQAGVELPIRSVIDDELIKQVATAAKWICRDVGIKDWNNPEIMKYDATRFFTTLKKYYKELSMKEVKMAFELAAVGELDEWLPKDRNGNPDKNHYQSFSLEYYTKILNAYRAKRGGVWHKARKALPLPEFVLTEKQKEENRRAFIQDIYDAFHRYKNDGIKPNFVLRIFIDEFVGQGIIKSVPKPTKKTIDGIYRNMISGGIPRNERKSLIDKYHDGVVDGSLLSQAERKQNNLTIEKIFDKWIEDKIDISEKIK